MSSVYGRYLKDENGNKFSPVTSMNTVVDKQGTKLPKFVEGDVLFSGKIQGIQTLSGVDWGSDKYGDLWIQMLLASSRESYYGWIKMVRESMGTSGKFTSVCLSTGIVVGVCRLYCDAMNLIKVSNNNTYAIQGSDHAQNEMWVTKILAIPKIN